MHQAWLMTFFLNLLSWSCQNAVAVALKSSTYIWEADTGAVIQLGECHTYLALISLAMVLSWEWEW
jgi:hypothetical protein